MLSEDSSDKYESTESISELHLLLDSFEEASDEL